MKRLLFALVATATVGIAPALAADLPVKAPMMKAAVYNWTGCFIGGNAGGGRAREDYEDPLAVPTWLGGHGASGLVGGGQIGCDFQTGTWVFGVQGLWNAANLSAS